MYDVENCFGERSWPCKTRCIYIYIRSRNKMVALGYAYTLEKQASDSPKHCTSQNATSAEF